MDRLLDPHSLRWARLALVLAGRAAEVPYRGDVAGPARTRSLRILAATVVGAAPATFVCHYRGERAPTSVEVPPLTFRVVIGGAVVATVVGRRRRRKPVPP